jgi:Secretion system C-terminal sorting domain
MTKLYWTVAWLCLFLFLCSNGFSQAYYPAGMNNSNLSTWLDAADATTITTGYVSTGATTTTTVGGFFSHPDRLPTSADLSNTVLIGTQLQVGTDTYTVTAITTSYLAITPNFANLYTNQTIKRLAVSKWSDKSGTSGRDLISPVTLASFTSTETTTANEPSYLAPVTGNPSISFINTGANATAQYLQGTGTTTYGVTTNRSLAFVAQINSYSNAGGGSDGQGTYLFDRNPDLVSGTPLFSIKFESNTLSEQIRDDAGNLANNSSTITSPAAGTFLNMSLIRSGGTDQFYNNGATAGSSTVSTGTSTMQPICITYHAGDDNNSAQAQNLNMYEVILTNNTLSTTYRQLEEGYLAWKWGTQTNLGSTHPYKNAGQTGFTNDLVGIGRVSATDSVLSTQTTDGLGFVSAISGFIQDNGDYLTAIDNNADGSEDGSVVTVNSINRLNRVWYVSKTDLSTHTGGTVTLYVDYGMLADGTLPSNTAGSYTLIYNATDPTFPNTSSTKTITATTTTIVGTQVQFTLNATGLANGYYTLKTCSKSSVFDYTETPYCTTGGNATVTLLTGGGIPASAGSFSISPTVTAGFSSGNGKITVNSITPGTYTVTNTVSGSNSCTSTSTAPITIEPAGTWVGGVSTDWNTPGNWPCSSVPTSATNVIIPNGVSNYPVISTTGKAFVNNITVQSGAAVTLTNDTLNVFGTISSTSAITATSGTIEMRGSAAQNIGGSMLVSKTISNLVDSNQNTSTGLTIADSLYITGFLNFATTTATKLATNNVLVLVSNATTTASVGQIAELSGTPRATITGNVTAQRYFPAHRRWRLITSPVASTQTINAAWQEGVVSTTSPLSNPNPNPGYGTHITGPGRTTFALGLGYDQSPTNSASIAVVQTTTGWVSIPNTNLITVTSHPGYMLFVRGGRDYTISSTTQTTPATNATLRTVGTIRTGLQNTATVSGFNVIRNPYPAVINFNTIFNNSGTNHTANTFYLWDPNIASAANVASGTGGWVALTSNASGGYIATVYPSGSFSSSANGGFDISGDIQSGAAFLVNATGTGNIAIDEAAKVSSSSVANETYLFRPADDTAATTTPALLSTTLFATTADSTHAPVYVADGTVNIFSTSFSNDVSWDEDAQKANNTNENLSIIKSGQLMSIEKSAPVNFGDTVFFTMSGMKASPYQFNFTTTNFNRPDLNAFLVDSAAKTTTPISLGDSAGTIVNFTVTSDPATYAANRFYILFRPAPGSVTYNNVTAAQQDKNISVQWIVSNQLNINKYVVERSADGVNFYAVDTTAAINTTTTYNWLDVNANLGNNYYRIESIDNTGAIAYSKTVEVVIGKGITQGIAIYPNPVTNDILQLQMNNMPDGEYGIKVIDALGQTILTEEIDHGTFSETKSILLNKDLANGMYMLEIMQPDKTITKINFEKQ